MGSNFVRQGIHLRNSSPPPISSAYEAQSFGIIASGVMYGCVVMQFFDCISLLLKTRRRRSKNSQVQVILFTLLIFSSSTAALVQGLIYLGSSRLASDTGLQLSKRSTRITDLGIPISFPITAWEANGIMVHMRFSY